MNLLKPPGLALKKAATAYQRAGKAAEADKVARELREKYPNYAGG